MGGGGLVSDYLAEEAGAEPFYRGSYRSASHFRDKAAEVEADFDRARRERFPGLIRPVSEQAEEKLQRVRAEEGFVVTTGQQPGLFGGPLYSLYKALTAVRLAEVLEETLSRPVMQLFWIASDDHDWEEANHTWLIDSNNDLRELSLGPRADALEASLARSLLGPGVGAAIEGLRDCLPGSDFSADWLDRVGHAYRPENTVASAFTELMEALLGDTALGFVDAADPALKEAATPVLEREIVSAAEGEALLAERTRLLEQAGYSGQVTLMEGGLNLFWENGAGRQRLFRDGEAFRYGRGGESIERQELLSRLRDDARDFSPNVLLRPVVESFLFPTLSYVGGPGEMAYFGQLGPFFRHHDVGPPIVTPRASFL
ncbi:MAG: bacillithiol biosynthesis cysteine-adding enzyme BshC, partial [Gemmatimonadetes bacterium]|nr:bacillithiol biosynthesis cysteine-adding enzyme BshC [Gemmatimonadota bacterium]